MPALAITTSIPPNVATAWATAASISANEQTSPVIDVASAPSSAVSASSGSRSRSTSTTLAPLATSPRAVSAPTPRAPPVTRTTCPLSLLMNASVPSTAPGHRRWSGGLCRGLRVAGRRGGRGVRGVPGDEVADGRGDQPRVVPHRRVADAGVDAELDAGDLGAQPRRVVLHRQDAVLGAPRDQHGDLDLVEVVQAGLAAAQDRVDVLDDRAVHR